MNPTLARNVVLLTVIADGIDPAAAWSIFYDFFLDKTSYDILLSHCRSLIQASPDIQTWAASKYGPYLRFCTAESLADVRRYWIFYVETETLAAEAKIAHRDSFISGMKSILATYTHTNNDLDCLRSAGPVIIPVLEEGPKIYTQYWSTGVTTSQGSAPNLEWHQHLNPMFVHPLSGTKFNLHHGTNPITGFHLAPALTSIKGARSPFSKGIEMEDIVQSAFDQFSSWCTSLKDAISAHIIIRLFIGEALPFCQALHTCRELGQVDTSIYTRPWAGLQINFTTAEYAPTSPNPAPLRFNVIETRNLAKDVGLLNILVATTPLLQQEPQSVLRTNVILPLDETHISLANEACADIPTMSLLLGIAPSFHLSRFTACSHQHEVLGGSVITPGHYCQSISWRFPTHSVSRGPILNQKVNADLLVCDPEDLANFFFSVYLRMFKDDNPSTGVAFLIDATGHYMRSGFVAFLALVKERVEVSWEQAMKHLVYRVGSDKTLLMGISNYQDLICHLYLRGLYNVESLHLDCLERLRGTADRFNGWNDIPSVVCVVLVIPRQHIKVLEDMNPDAIRTPTLQCESKGSTFHNIHASFQAIFGTVQVSEVEGEPIIALNEDLSGWEGDSPLIVTFYMPSWILTYAPTDTQIGLFVRSTPRVTKSLYNKLGFLLPVYETSLADTEHIHVSPHRPNNLGEIYRLRELGIASESKSRMDGGGRQKVVVKFDPLGRKITTTSIRDMVTVEGVAKSLRNGAYVSHKPLSDCSALVTFEGYRKEFVFPFPVLGTQSKTKIARKSSYIEVRDLKYLCGSALIILPQVESPIRADFESRSDFNPDPFPIFCDGNSVNILSIHYVNLDILPALQLPLEKGRCEWLSSHLEMTVPKHIGRESNQKPPSDGSRTLRDTIYQLFIRACGLEDPHPISKAFLLRNPSGMGDQALIIGVNEVRLDLCAHTVVLDACAIPVTEENKHSITPLLPEIFSDDITEIIIFDDEIRAWRCLIPVLAERCRTWQHSDTCKYLTKGTPIDLDNLISSSLCGCGRGKDLGPFATIPERTIFREDATRIAIEPLFGFPSNAAVLMKENMDAVRDSILRSRSAFKASSSAEECAQCVGPGKPTLQACSICKKVKYCSRGCQKSHWKVHKLNCRPATAT